MKLRLTQPGFETYTAQMGVLFFENGLSTTDVLVMDATRMAAVMQCEWENGSPANVGQIYLDNMHTPAPVVTPAVFVEEAPADLSALRDIAYAGLAYTEVQLAEIADAEGISGLRMIADGLGIKGNSIRGLIDAIVNATGTLV